MRAAVLGISAYYHDSAASIVVDGVIEAAAHEERFTRNKHDPGFPKHAIKYCLDESGISPQELQAVVFYDKPYLKFERLLETYHGFAPRGLRSFFMAVPVWLKNKLFIKKQIARYLREIGYKDTKIYFCEHHHSHAASAFYPSPFRESAILTIDGVGEWATATICYGNGKDINILKELHFPHSLGMLYSSFTYYCGFKVNSGEYKLMGLAPYGDAFSGQTREFVEKIKTHLVKVMNDGSIQLNMKYFNFATGLEMTNNKKWEELFGVSKRKEESELTQEYMNLALANQIVTEEIIFKMAEEAKRSTKSKKLVMAGGVSLNSVATGKLLKSGMFEDIWVQPAAGDAGGSLGAALMGWYLLLDNEREVDVHKDSMKGAYLGPEYPDLEIERTLKKYNSVYSYFSNFNELCEVVANLIDKGNVIGWFQGRMEFGPRALGNRSIIGDARNPDMQKKMNLKIKYRESFRPFAPSVLEEDASDYFDIDRPSPYMLLVVPVQEKRRRYMADAEMTNDLKKRLYFQRSDIPAVTHIDHTARLQSVNKDTNPRYWQVINEFKNISSYGVIVNTSFNVRGEPIVCEPDDAFRCFMRTEMDYLVMGNYFVSKKAQKELVRTDQWKEKFALD